MTQYPVCVNTLVEEIYTSYSTSHRLALPSAAAEIFKGELEAINFSVTGSNSLLKITLSVKLKLAYVELDTRALKVTDKVLVFNGLTKCKNQISSSAAYKHRIAHGSAIYLGFRPPNTLSVEPRLTLVTRVFAEEVQSSFPKEAVAEKELHVEVTSGGTYVIPNISTVHIQVD